MPYTVQDKINVIQNSSSLGDLPVDVMPYTQSEEYYFVSYSHLDYKEVYSDILKLQEQGLNIWYDRGLPAGRDWEKSAYEAIVKHSCVGVIFYLSKNSLLSSAVAREIELVKELGKDYLSVNIPLSENSASLSANLMLKQLSENNMVDSHKEKTVKNAFNENIIFIDYNATAEFKADKIRLLKRAELLNFEVVETINDAFSENRYRKYIPLEDEEERVNYGEPYARLTSINDIDITEITIPKTVEINGKTLRVREIGECAFANCKYLQNVNFPPLSSIYIDEKAFFSCTSLKKVDLGCIERVGEYAFGECENLEEVAIDGVISSNAFAGCKKLKSVYLYPLLGKIGSGNFLSGQIEDFNTEDSSDFKFANGVLSYYSSFGWDSSSIAICGNATDKKLQIPAYVNEIAEGAFANYKDLEEVTLFTNLKKIGEKAFYKCENLKDFVFVLHNKAKTAKSLTFEKSSFAYCTGLNSVTIPNQTVEIKDMAFLCCTNIKNVVFENNSNLKIIGRQAFDRCLSIEKLFIPDSVESIGINAFAECNSLQEVVFNESSNLAEIHAEAFVFCKKLNSVVLPPSLKSISERAFFGCENLKKIYYLGAVEQFDLIEIKKENAGKKLIISLDADTPAEKITVVCLNGESAFEKNEDLTTRLYDSNYNVNKNKNGG